MSDFLETPNPRSSDWSRLTLDSMIRTRLREAGVYQRAAKAGWPIGITFSDYCHTITKVTITAGCAPDTLILGTALREDGKSFRPALDALIDQVIGQLNLLV